MFLLVDEATDKFYKNKQVRLGASLATVKHLPYKPRIAELTKGSDGYGFFLRKEPKMSGESEVSELFLLPHDRKTCTRGGKRGVSGVWLQ